MDVSEAFMKRHHHEHGDTRSVDALQLRIGRRVITDRLLYGVSRQAGAAYLRSGLRQAGIARRMGTSTSAVSRLLNAAGPRPSLTTLERFAAAVGHRLEVRLVPILAGYELEIQRFIERQFTARPSTPPPACSPVSRTPPR
jgi:transcriptional regulator with XRE-family HTH domain